MKKELINKKLLLCFEFIKNNILSGFSGYIEINKNGFLHGEQKSYYENGQLKCIFSCVNNKMNGIYKEHHENGKIKEIYSLVNGERNWYV
jgi:antitoxin component YwqK of YwqJK toxin-antitoxin module